MEMTDIYTKNFNSLTRKEHFSIVNAQLIKYMLSPWKYKGSCIAANIPIKYLPHFKVISKSKKAINVRYIYRGKSKPGYQRPQSYCHMNMADTFSLYYR